MTPAPGFLRYLDRQLERRGWTVRDLAREAGLSSAVIYRWRSAETEPGIPNARLAASALGVPLLEFLVAAGAITSDEAGAPVSGPLPGELSSEDLIDELRRRVGARAAGAKAPEECGQ